MINAIKNIKTREIKFRVFGYDALDLENNKVDTSFLTEKELNMYCSKVKPQMFYDIFLQKDCAFYGKCYDINNLIKIFFPKIMQSTHIKDIQGKEIYEHDIVIVHRKDDGKYIEKPYKTIVTWCDKTANFGLKDIKWGYEEFFQNIEYEIIGNIYENPELIKN